MEKENEENIWRREIFFCGREGKGGKYLERKDIWSVGEKEKEENIWRREKYSSLEGKSTTTNNWVNIVQFAFLKV